VSPYEISGNPDRPSLDLDGLDKVPFATACGRRRVNGVLCKRRSDRPSEHTHNALCAFTHTYTHTHAHMYEYPMYDAACSTGVRHSLPLVSALPGVVLCIKRKRQIRKLIRVFILYTPALYRWLGHTSAFHLLNLCFFLISLQSPTEEIHNRKDCPQGISMHKSNRHSTHTHQSICVHTYMYGCVCVCVCVYYTKPE